MRLALLCPVILGVFSTYAGEIQKPRHQQIDYGPFVSATIDAQWPRHNITYKGVAIRLKSGGQDKGAVLFDTDLLRVSAGWTGGFLNFDKDVAHARDYRSILPEGTQLIGTFQRPGIAKPGANDFNDSRTMPFGPLPRDWCKYKGLYVHGDNVVLSYRAGDSDVLELPAYETVGGLETLTRTLQFSAASKALSFLLTERDGVRSEVMLNGRMVVLRRAAGGDNEKVDGVRVTMDRVEDNWERLSIGGPARNDYGNNRKNVEIKPVAGLARPHGKFTNPEQVEALPQLHDGGGSGNFDDVDRNVWFDAPGRFLIDLKRAVNVKHVDTFSWGRDERAAQRYTLYGSAAETEPAANGPDPAAAGWKLLAKVDTREQGVGGMHGVSIHAPKGTLGKFRFLLLAVEMPGKQGTYFSEIDVFAHTDAPKFPDLSLPEGQVTAVALVGEPKATLLPSGRSALLNIPANTAGRVKVVHFTGTEGAIAQLQKVLSEFAAPAELTPLTKGGPRRWNEDVETQGRLSDDDKKPYVVDTITLPEENPWRAWMRPGGFDFFGDNTTAALCNWSGDVWTVGGINDKLDKLTWRRVATGLFHPLGLRIVQDRIYVLGRDQITRLHDLNGDGEADFYENFNNDVMVTWNFHEFAFDLQTDKAGNFYFAKGAPVRNGGRGFDRIAEHNGCLLRVSPDGAQLDRIATGFRAPNGFSVTPDGNFTSGDNEGTWMPVCRLNWIIPGGFYGVKNTAHRTPPPEFTDPPICWMPKETDNSSGGQVWVDSDRFGPFKGEMLHLSYGACSLHKVMHEFVDTVPQGGIVKFPLRFDSGIMRARFNAGDGQLYVCGVKGWQTTAARDGCFQRVRYTGKPVLMPAKLHAAENGIAITLTAPLNRTDAADPENYAVEQWNYLYSEAYGSDDYSVANPEQKKRDTVEVKAVEVSADGKTVLLKIDNLQRVMQMKITFNLDGADGSKASYVIYNTINKLGKPFVLDGK